MNRHAGIVFALCLLAPLASRADDAAPPSTDVFSYSYLEANRLSERSDFFASRSAGDGLKFSYDSTSMVYLFGQWNRLNFDSRSGSHDLYGLGVGAHQAYSTAVSFYADLSFLRDKLDSSTLSGASENYWRFAYGFRGHMSSSLELDGAIFTERRTQFGARPFGERLGLGLDFSPFSVTLSGEHTADGNRTELSFMWNYK